MDMYRVTWLDRTRNERIRGTTTGREIFKKAQERRVLWCGHVIRRVDEYVCKTVMDVQGKRRKMD